MRTLPIERARGSRRGRPLALAALAAGYALGAAATTPFTWQADLVTALPIALVALASVVCWPWHPRPRAVAAGTHPYLPWAGLGAVVVAWELANYWAQGVRAAHPTLSSLADAVDHHYVLKALVFFAWLCLGAWVVDLGARRLPAAAGTVPSLP